MSSRNDTATLDPFVVIEGRGSDWINYRSLESGERWTVRGVCNQCGLCVVGVAHPEHYGWHGEPGTPFAVTDLRVAQGRLDEPIAPGFDMPGCTLTIERAA